MFLQGDVMNSVALIAFLYHYAESVPFVTQFNVVIKCLEEVHGHRHTLEIGLTKSGLQCQLQNHHIKYNVPPPV